MPHKPPNQRYAASRTKQQRNRAYDQRRTRDQPWRAWYWTAAWRKKAKAQLAAEPLCRACLRAGRVTEARVADHVLRHRGDADLFWNGDLQSLCDECHNSVKQSEERLGYAKGADIDGRPLDPAHPWNRG